MSREQVAEILKAVRDMRKAQKDYFRTRTGESLDRSKQLEQRVDQLLRDYDEPRLFPS